MELLLNIVFIIQILVAIVMVGLILLQQGKGAEMGAAFGSGSSGSLFGATGGVSFMSRTTAILAAVFFTSTLVLAYFGNIRPKAATSVLESAIPAAITPASAASSAVPALPTSAPAAAQIPTK